MRREYYPIWVAKGTHLYVILKRGNPWKKIISSYKFASLCVCIVLSTLSFNIDLWKKEMRIRSLNKKAGIKLFFDSDFITEVIEKKRVFWGEWIWLKISLRNYLVASLTRGSCKRMYGKILIEFHYTNSKFVPFEVKSWNDNLF